MDAATIVKRIRSLNGITRKQLADLAGLSPSTIGRIEQGRLDPTWGTLSRILDATGYQINGDSIVSAGDTRAIAAARPWLETLLDSIGSSVLDSATTMSQVIQQATAETLTRLSDAVADSLSNIWWDRWRRAGWLDEARSPEDLVSLAVAAGNAAKISRRVSPQRRVEAPDGWQSLARALGAAEVDYAVSGLVATREDRTTAEANMPIMYVSDLSGTIEQLSLVTASSSRGVLLIEAADGELDDVEVSEGIRFVGRAQAVLDAFAGSGREPDKAENELRRMLASA